jgi:hypothetical protein
MYTYFDMYENADVWVILKQVNQKTLFLPMLCLQYQHGGGWAGVFVPSPITTSLTLLGIQR